MDYSEYFATQLIFFRCITLKTRSEYTLEILKSVQTIFRTFISLFELCEKSSLIIKFIKTFLALMKLIIKQGNLTSSIIDLDL